MNSMPTCMSVLYVFMCLHYIEYIVSVEGVESMSPVASSPLTLLIFLCRISFTCTLTNTNSRVAIKCMCCCPPTSVLNHITFRGKREIIMGVKGHCPLMFHCLKWTLYKYQFVMVWQPLHRFQKVFTPCDFFHILSCDKVGLKLI